MAKGLFTKSGFHQTVDSLLNLTGIAPLRGSRAALPIACDALNARTVAIREYHYVFLRVVARKLPARFAASVFVARSPMEKSWRTRRMARRKRNVSDLPYTAPPLSCVAFFVKEQGRGQIERAKRKGGRFAFCVNLP